MMRREIEFEVEVGPGAWKRVRLLTERGRVSRYAVVLVARDGDDLRTIRVFDNAHGANEMHRYTRSGGKERGEVFHHGRAPEAAQAAERAVTDGWYEMVIAWRA
jgi:hypothetical protein